jgi:hypothetical protein
MAAILPELYCANVGALSIEFANPRRQHEYDALRQFAAGAMLLMPGVLDGSVGAHAKGARMNNMPTNPAIAWSRPLMLAPR